MNEDVGRIARRISAEEYANEKRRFFVTAVLPGDEILAKCTNCPKGVFDIRRAGVAAFYSSKKFGSVAEAEEWWDAHRSTEMHEWYRNAEPTAGDEDRKLASIFGREVVLRKMPFKFARRRGRR